MGEGALSSADDAMNSEPSQRRRDPMVRWERFLPRMVLRVLLVEADDSTRQIIAALLRRCSYKVTAVKDGLGAWEILKGQSSNIDLILTEVDLPSISGFALLTLIMEHEICKTIPVIMMSSQDSVRMVYKCMLRGAADFLVKPLRKNELMNLWQHVWRRQNLTNSGAHDESVAQQKVEVGAESNDASNHFSSAYIVSSQKNREHLEKGSYAQSSSTKPDIEADEMCPRNTHELPKSGQDYVGLLKNGEVSPSNKKLKTLDACVGQFARSSTNPWEKLVRQPTVMSPNFSRGVEVAGSKKDKIINDEKPESHLHNSVEVFATNPLSAVVVPLKEAIDLIGAFGDCSNTICRSVSPPSDYIIERVEDYNLKLDLSLRGSCASVSINQIITTAVENQRLNHSDSSAFSRYIHKKYDWIESSSPKVVHETVFARENSNHIQNLNTTRDFGAATLTVPVPFKGGGIRVDNLFSRDSYFKMNHPFEQSNIDRRNSQKLCSSPTTEQQVLNNNNSEKNKYSEDNKQLYFDQIPGHWIAAENVNDRILQRRSVQREAALKKFRQKRKERCYEKKVRYESRKKLAEQRPRVKGQFVRQPLVEEINSERNSDES